MNEQIREKYLPVGTVVMLKNASKRVMVIGFCIVPENDPDKLYDYLGCVYPEGIMDADQNLMFNHDQIDKIYHMGLEDEEEKVFKAELKKVLEETEKEKTKIESVLTRLEDE